MDCEQIPDWIQAFGTLLIGGAAVFSAWKGSTEWTARKQNLKQELMVRKLELEAERESELASKLLAGTYKMRDGLNFVRHPFIRAGEMAEDGENPPSSSNEKQYFKAQLYAYENRWNKVNEARQGINELLISAEVIWGEDIKALFDEYFQHSNNILRALEDLLAGLNPSTDPSTRRPPSDLVDERHNFYRRGDPENPFDKNQKEIIDKIDAFLKPKLKS